MKMGYKVVKRVCRDGAELLVSTVVIPFAGVVYTPGEWTIRRPGRSFGPLAVFDSLGDAVAFSGPKAFEIWECEYLPSKSRTLWATGVRTAQAQFPAGTRLADAVKLIRPVELQ